jgi:hypothetical protein
VNRELAKLLLVSKSSTCRLTLVIAPVGIDVLAFAYAANAGAFGKFDNFCDRAIVGPFAFLEHVEALAGTALDHHGGG